MPKGPSTSQYIGGNVADQLSKMAATIIGSMQVRDNNAFVINIMPTFKAKQIPFERSFYIYMLKKTESNSE